MSNYVALSYLLFTFAFCPLFLVTCTCEALDYTPGVSRNPKIYAMKREFFFSLTCHMLLVTCHLSLVTCHMSLVTCHL